MDKQTYYERNKLGFEGDEYIADEIKRICKAHKIDLILETGSMYGWTAKRFAELAETHSCELNTLNYKIAKENAPEVQFYNQSSPKFLEVMLALNKDKSILIYLDAHGPVTTPLLEELEVIAASGVKPCIVIHDFKIPDEPKLGFDTYNNQSYTWEWIENHIAKIYGPACLRTYNSEANAGGAMRGVVYLQPIFEDKRISYPEDAIESTTEIKYNEKLEVEFEKVKTNEPTEPPTEESKPKRKRK